MSTLLATIMPIFSRVRDQEPKATRIPRVEAMPPREKRADGVGGMELTALEKMRGPVLACAVRKMLHSPHFSICTFDAVFVAAEVVPDGEVYRLLRALHCVDWMDMPPEVRAWVASVTVKMLSAGENDLGGGAGGGSPGSSV